MNTDSVLRRRRLGSLCRRARCTARSPARRAARAAPAALCPPATRAAFPPPHRTCSPQSWHRLALSRLSAAGRIAPHLLRPRLLTAPRSTTPSALSPVRRACRSSPASLAPRCHADRPPHSLHRASTGSPRRSNRRPHHAFAPHRRVASLCIREHLPRPASSAPPSTSLTMHP
ncbi:hypothetical protein ZWY2020_035910 [Hordeum vulgare]|nr:hypothetical protein ZWY2020_035910 [Hordeum vulgare]